MSTLEIRTENGSNISSSQKTMKVNLFEASSSSKCIRCFILELTQLHTGSGSNLFSKFIRLPSFFICLITSNRHINVKMLHFNLCLSLKLETKEKNLKLKFVGLGHVMIFWNQITDINWKYQSSEGQTITWLKYPGKTKLRIFFSKTFETHFSTVSKKIEP